MKKLKWVGLVTITLGFVCTNISVVNAEQLYSRDNTEAIAPFADIIDWVYKIENGKLYKRKYNMSKGTYIGAWMLV